MRRPLAAPGIYDQPRDRRQVRARDKQHIGAVGGERSSGDRPRDHTRQVEHADARQRPLAGRQRPGRRVTDLGDLQRRQPGNRLPLRMHCPLLRGSHRRHDAAGRIGGRLECLRLPPQQRRLNTAAHIRAVEQVDDRPAVMGKVGVQAYETTVGRDVDTCQRIPGLRRLLADDPQIALAAELDRGMTHRNVQPLGNAGALPMHLRRCQSRRRDGYLRRRPHRERRGKLRVGACQHHLAKRGRIAAAQPP